MKAYAKVNLSLDILSKRSDGYHLLQSVMQQISLADDISLGRGTDGITICCNQPHIPTDERNIVYKTAAAFFAYTEIDVKDVNFTIKKRIPSGAGLGGGSSDGVTALKLLDRYYQTHLSKAEMCEIVAPIGADMPFFVYGHTALCEGVGELVTPLPALTRGALVLLKPDVSLSTPKMYAAYDGAEKQCHPDTDALITAVRNGDLALLGKAMENSLEPVGVQFCPVLTDLRRMLLQCGALGAMMSGSGSTVYGLFSDLAEAKKAAGRILQSSRFKHSCYVCTFL